MKILKDSNVTILHHPRKPNVVANIFSKKTIGMGSFSFLRVSRNPSAKKFQTLASQYI